MWKDLKAFEVFFRTAYPRWCQTVRTAFDSDADAEAAVQAAMQALWAARGEIHKPEQAEAFLADRLGRQAAPQAEQPAGWEALSADEQHVLRLARTAPERVDDPTRLGEILAKWGKALGLVLLLPLLQGCSTGAETGSVAPGLLLGIVLGYFALLFGISWVTSREADSETFFSAKRSSPWYLVAFGMIGATLSGVTFISIPGAVGNGGWAYMQMVLGYLVGYAVIALILLPLYYRLNLTSIYGYLDQRFGPRSYLSGSVLFQLSRIVGSSLRLYLVALVLHLAVVAPLAPQLPFALTVFLSITLIYLYTYRGGIKTVVWTDTLQTGSMLVGAGIAVYVIASSLHLDPAGVMDRLAASEFTQMFYWDWGPGNNFFKQFFSGAFIAIVMTGLDQDMMQKNLTVRTLADAQKNVFWFSVVLVLANLLFLSLGALLYEFGLAEGLIEVVFSDECKIRILDPATQEMVCKGTDELFPLLALHYLGPIAAICFIIGVIAAAYSSADSALTALTTAFCVDILRFDRIRDEARKLHIRHRVQFGYSVVLFGVILFFAWLNDDAVIWAIFKAAGYTYGPLLGLYTFGLYTSWQVKDRWVPWVCGLAPLMSYLIQWISPSLFGYTFGFEVLILNGLLTMLGLWLIRQK